MARAKKNTTTATENTAIENVQEVAAEETTEVTEKEPKLNPYATNAMRPVIIAKSLAGSRKAITAKMCEENGVTEERLQEWQYNCNKLYEAAVEYSKAIGTDQELERENEVWEIWRSIIRVGEEDIFHPNMFVRKKDVENLRVLAAESDEIFIDGIGFVPTVKGQTAFRSKVEIRLALRIAGNKTLNDRQRQVITDYKGAERRIKSARELLDGYTRGNTTVASLDAQIAEAEKERDAIVATLNKLGVKETDEYTKRQRNVIQQLTKQKKSAQDRIASAEKVIRQNQESYDNIIATLDSIENPGEKVTAKDNRSISDVMESISATLNK